MLIFNICAIILLRNPLDQFMDADNPYRDDIAYSREKDLYIITAITDVKIGYIDYYKDIYYKPYLYCHWMNSGYGFYPLDDSNICIPNYMELQNINEANLKHLHSYG